MHKFHPSIFREYDIRGVFGETLHEADAFHIGRGLAKIIAVKGSGKRIAVGFDGRLSSPALTSALIDGLVKSGIEVLNIGLGPTPMLYFSVFHLNADGGIMVTGSHNPKNHNGFKIMLGKSSLYGAGIREIREAAESGGFIDAKGCETRISIRDEYIKTLLKATEGGTKLKTVWDPGNGATGEIVSEICRHLAGNHKVINAAIDGDFPAHHPDPTVEENLRDVISAIKTENLDFGVAFDGDGDRVGIVDGKGRMLMGDQLMILFAREVLRENPGATVIGDVKASKALYDEIRRAGGTPLMWRTGHSLIKAKMAEIKAPLAGEVSGHIFFADKYFGFDDGIYAALRLVDIAAKSGKSIARMHDELPKMESTPEIKISCADERKFQAVEEVKENLRKAGRKFNDIDGVRVEAEKGWWLLRASNTGGHLIARCEAEDKQTLDKMKGELEEELGRVRA